MNYRYYTERDSREIESLVESVFSAAEGELEGKRIGKLARDLLQNTEPNDLKVFVATDQSTIVGCIFVTRMPSNKENDIFLLAPVAVHTEYQGRAIGQGLIKFGIAELGKRGVKFLVTYGDPNFYSKVGFTAVKKEVIEPPFPLSQPKGWLAQSLDGTQVSSSLGKCSCVPAFNNPDY